MLKTVFYHFSLFWLCLRLIFSILNFSLKILFNKILVKSWLFPLLTIICCSLLAFNIYLIKEKSVTKVETQDISFPNLNLENKEFISLDQNEVDSRIEYYLELEKQGIKNLNLYLNLAVLFQDKNQEISNNYFKKAQQIDPNNSIFQ